MGCGPDPAAQAELEDVCGGPSPLRVLELGPDEAVRGLATISVQDRVLYVVSRVDEDAPDAAPASGESTVWATGPCGESPVQVATGVDHVFTVDAWPDVALGCEEATGNVVVLDPTGARAPHVAFSAIAHDGGGCGLKWTDFGVVAVEQRSENFGALRLYPYPDDPWTGTSVPVALIDPIPLTESYSRGTDYIGNVVYAYPDHVLARTPERTLVRIELADVSVSTLQTEVAAFAASRAGEFVLWQDTTITVEHSGYHEGEVFLRELANGEDVPLGETALGYSFWPLLWAEQGLVMLGFGPVSKGLQRIFFLPELDFVDLPAGTFLNAKLADGRWLGGPLGAEYVEAFDLRAGASTRLFPRVATVVGLEDDAVRVLEVPRCCADSDPRAEGPMWRVPLDGSPATQMSARATRLVQFLGDGRMVGPVGANAQGLASLVLVEAETGAEARIDDSVYFYSMDPRRVQEEGIVRYSVVDGDRSGVYLAKLPAAARSVTARAGGEVVTVDWVPGPDGRPAPQLAR